MDSSQRAWDAVFWDIGGVILEHESILQAHKAFISELIETFALEVPTEMALETWQQAVGAHFHEREGTDFRLAEDAYQRGVEAVVGESVEKDRWRPLFDDAFLTHIEPKPNAISTLTALTERDVHLGIISDIDDREATAILTAFGLDSTFDSVTTSEEVGRTKPDAKMFDTALQKASASPSRSLMIGDRYEHDMEGGANAGMWTVAYGANAGPAVDFRISDLATVVALVDGDHDSAPLE
jgi:putative hydrolase of the HAD superfamily